MTVQELIEQLKAMPPEAVVFVAQGEYADEEASKVVLIADGAVAIY